MKSAGLTRELIALRVAKELRDGMVVNLGIGVPTLVSNFIPEGMTIFFQAENGLLGYDRIAAGGENSPAPDHPRRPAGAPAVRRLLLPQRRLLRHDPGRPRGPDGAGRPPGVGEGCPGQMVTPRARRRQHRRRPGPG